MPTRKFTFHYLPVPKKDSKTQEVIGQVFYPVVPIRISYGHRLGRTFHALLDSGAGRNLFPAELGELVGIPVKKGKTVDILGIGGVVIKGLTHKIKVYVGTESFHTNADFSYEQQVPLLGREGFFDLFRKVLFKQKEKSNELWHVWKKGRNLLFHYFPHNFHKLTFSAAEAIRDEMLRAMEWAIGQCRIRK